MGTPVTFMSSKGPMPMRNAFLAAASMVGMSATPCSSSRTDSLSQGTKNRFTTKPGRSRQRIGTFAIRFDSRRLASTAAGLVLSPGITSTSRFLAGW